MSVDNLAIFTKACRETIRHRTLNTGTEHISKKVFHEKHDIIFGHFKSFSNILACPLDPVRKHYMKEYNKIRINFLQYLFTGGEEKFCQMTFTQHR